MRPLVSCLITTYNYGRYLARAIDSVLAQTYPADRIEIVVTDDGSTDDTASVVEPYLGRVRYVRKENGGLLSSVNRGLDEATGELIAFLSADDMWPATKVERQVDLLVARPEVGLVYSDLEVIGPHDEPLAPSLWATAGLVPERGRILGRLLGRNLVSGGAMMLRASLSPLFHPIPPDAAWEDWWIAFCVARAAEIDFIPEPLYRYRYHGTNMNLGAEGEKFARILQAELPFRRAMLRALSPGEVRPEELVAGLVALSTSAEQAARALGLPLTTLLPVDDRQRAEAAAEHAVARTALDRGDRDGAIWHLVRSLAADPLDGERQTLLESTLRGQGPTPLRPAARADPLAGARTFRTLAFVDDLFEDPTLLRGYAGSVSAADDATLVVLGIGLDEAQLNERLAPLCERAGLDRPDAPDVLGVVLPTAIDPAALAPFAHALLAGSSRSLARLPRVDAATTHALATLPGRRAANPDIPPLVSIVVLTLNQLHRTRECLESVIANTRVPFELIVVDNGSTDGTIRHLRDLAARTPELRVIENADNRGFAAGNNQGLAVARGTHALLLNNDTVVPRDWLTPMLAVLERHPRAGLVGPLSNSVSGPQLLAVPEYETGAGLDRLAAAIAERNAGRSIVLPRLVGFCLLVHGDLLRSVGGLDEQFFPGNFEDDDYCVRAHHAGFEARLACDAFVHHYGSQTFAGQGIDYSGAFRDGWARFKAKWGIAAERDPAEGYVLPLHAPAAGLHCPLPVLGLTHELTADGRWWSASRAAAA